MTDHVSKASLYRAMFAAMSAMVLAVTAIFAAAHHFVA
jgi:hypothetical protein